MILVTSVFACCFQISTSVAFDTFCEVKLIGMWWCPILWLPISILCGVECGCEYTSGALLLNWMDWQICRLCSPNWPPNSMPLNLFWTTKIHGSWSCDWSTNVLATFCNSTCLAIPTLMWKKHKRTIHDCMSFFLT